MDQCIEKLIQFDPNTIESAMATQMNNNNALSDDDADVVVESEEVQHPIAAKKLDVASGSQQKDDTKKTPWPSYQNTGFSSVNAPLPNNNRYVSKQPRLMANSTDKHPDVPDIIKHIELNHRILICLRGAPGSGKSHLARSIVDRTMHGDYDNHIFSTDDFFYDRRTKRYIYDRSKLSQAHDQNQFRVTQRAMNGWSPIFIDNTNMKWWEMFPYIKAAVQHNYIVKILEPNTPWRISVGKLAQRNKHNVDQESIARMLNNYEPGTVNDILRTMQIHNYAMTPHLRCFPDIQVPVEQPVSRPNESRFTSKEQRSRRQENTNRNMFDHRMPSASDAQLSNFTEQWPAFEEEQTTFWNAEYEAKAKADKLLPKPQRKPTGNMSVAHMYDLLQDKSSTKTTTSAKEEDSAFISKKHKKDCPNENQSFQSVRQIYPQIPIALLWDLFEKCGGDGNWTMDILLNENETKEIEMLQSQEEIDRDNFGCDCEKPPALSGEFSQAVEAFPAEWLKDARGQPSPSRIQRRQKANNTNENEVLKHMEQQFVISDKHYSNHSRKIRRGATATNPIATTSSSQATASTSQLISSDDNINEDDEMIEIDLGIELVCQLDKNFGSNTFKSDSLKDIKTKVFMPKSLGQQLYATWIESLYHQIEEQKQQSIKEDEEFAKELQSKSSESQVLFDVPQNPSNIQNIADMEYAWKAYNSNSNEWAQTTREDLAMKLTKAKLFEIFPNVERDQLISVFSVYGNQFDKTVEFFKENIKTDIDQQMQAKSQELVTQAREAQEVNILYFSEKHSTVEFPHSNHILNTNNNSTVDATSNAN